MSGVCHSGIGGCLHSVPEGELSFTPGLGGVCSGVSDS